MEPEKMTAPQSQRKHVSIRMPDAMWKKLRKIAKSQGMTLNAFMLGVIKEITKESAETTEPGSKGAIKFV